MKVRILIYSTLLCGLIPISGCNKSSEPETQNNQPVEGEGELNQSGKQGQDGERGKANQSGKQGQSTND
jgi:hypothetical protein